MSNDLRNEIDSTETVRPMARVTARELSKEELGKIVGGGGPITGLASINTAGDWDQNED